MKSKAWMIIHAGFLLLLCKWIYDAWLLYRIIVVDIYTVIHELLTLAFAIVITIGFYIFCDDFATARKWSVKFKNSTDTHKTFSETLVSDLSENIDKKGEKTNEGTSSNIQRSGSAD